MSINGGTTANTTINVSKTGYTPIGVVGYESNSSHICPSVLFYDANINFINVYVKNTSTSNITDYVIRPYVLYLKNLS